MKNIRRKYTEVEQGSIAWKQARLGRFTGSQIGKLMQKGRGSAPFSQTALSYIKEVAAERMIDRTMLETEEEWQQLFDEINGPSTYAMRRGSEMEAYARDMYSRMRQITVHPGGFWSIGDNMGDSPDGLIMSEKSGKVVGCLEFKCPTMKVHLEHLMVRSGEDLAELNPLYYAQVQMHIAATGARWCDWCSYDYRSTKKMHIVRIRKDRAFIKDILANVEQAEDVIESYFKTIKKR